MNFVISFIVTLVIIHFTEISKTYKQWFWQRSARFDEPINYFEDHLFMQIKIIGKIFHQAMFMNIGKSSSVGIACIAALKVLLVFKKIDYKC